MRNWVVVTLLIVAIIAGLLGFGVSSGIAAEIAQFLFMVFGLLFLISIVAGRWTRGKWLS